MSRRTKRKLRHLMRIANLYQREHPGCLHLGDGSFLHETACGLARTWTAVTFDERNMK